MEMTHRFRQQNDSKFVDILEDLNSGNPSEKTVDALMNLNLNKLDKSFQERIKQKSVYIFATHEDKDNHNNKQLSLLCNKTNPLACLKYKDLKPRGVRAKIQHFYCDNIPLVTHFCVGSKVALKGRNIEPTWGLFNGTIGTVMEIVYKKGKNPNFGQIPKYVAVEFPSFCPPDGVYFHPYNRKVSIFSK